MIGLFGGSFDPFHNGHLNMCIELLERADLTQILICPAHISPFKMDKPPKASPQHRCKMIELAISGIDKLRLCDIEVKKEPPSFTVETLRELGSGHRLILASDALTHFFAWECADEILSLAPPIVVTRPGYSNKDFPADFVEIPQMDISSTRVRDRLAKGLLCPHLVPGKVLDYIYTNSLYSQE